MFSEPIPTTRAVSQERESRGCESRVMWETFHSLTHSVFQLFTITIYLFIITGSLIETEWLIAACLPVSLAAFVCCCLSCLTPLSLHSLCLCLTHSFSLSIIYYNLFIYYYWFTDWDWVIDCCLPASLAAFVSTLSVSDCLTHSFSLSDRKCVV